ncbi:MAG: imidazole glycerol phosphate synthase subunit HisH [Bacteroidota bacterium]
MIAVVDYGAGNLGSVARALRVLGEAPVIAADPETIAAADRLILPGVGAFAAGMANLTAGGLAEPIRTFIGSGRPFLGICVGLQVLLSESEEGTPENPRPRGLGIFPGRVRLLPGPGKVPQIGWNSLRLTRPHPLLDGLDGEFFYYVHSYYADPADRSLVAAETEYGIAFAAVLAHENVLAVQFHPEKSGRAGLRLLRAFCGRAA